MGYYARLCTRGFPIPSWRFCTAFLFFKNAVVVHGIMARLKQGVASSSLAGSLKGMGPTLVAIARSQLDEVVSDAPDTPPLEPDLPTAVVGRVLDLSCCVRLTGAIPPFPNTDTLYRLGVFHALPSGP